MLPARYPFLSEFQKALALDPSNRRVAAGCGVSARGAGAGSGCLAAAKAPVLQSRPEEGRPAENVTTLGLRSLDKGYMADALKYLQLAHEGDPQDFEVMLKLGMGLQHS